MHFYTYDQLKKELKNKSKINRKTKKSLIRLVKKDAPVYRLHDLYKIKAKETGKSVKYVEKNFLKKDTSCLTNKFFNKINSDALSQLCSTSSDPHHNLSLIFSFASDKRLIEWIRQAPVLTKEEHNFLYHDMLFGKKLNKKQIDSLNMISNLQYYGKHMTLCVPTIMTMN